MKPNTFNFFVIFFKIFFSRNSEIGFLALPSGGTGCNFPPPPLSSPASPSYAPEVRIICYACTPPKNC